MIDAAEAQAARPSSGGCLPGSLPHNPVVLKGYDPTVTGAAAGPDPERTGAEIGTYLIRLQGVGVEAATAFERALGLVGASVRMRERSATRDLWIAVSRQQIEVVRTQLLAASGEVLRLAEEVVTVLQAYYRRDFLLTCGSHRLVCGPRPLIMGIVNCTPDSFYGDSSAMGDAAVARAEAMVSEGADLIDIGGESTRPGSARVDAGEEIARVVPVLRRLTATLGVPVSIDTSKAAVASAAIDAGATMVNDISGLAYEPQLGEVVAASGVPLVLMHTRGRPADMYAQASYEEVVADVVAELREAVRRATLAGVNPEAMVIDPGLGFAKRAEHSLTLLRHTPVLRSLGLPILVGASRKSFIGSVLDLPAQERLEGTAAAVTAAVLGGAHIMRVHDVAAMRRVATMAAAIRYEGSVSDITSSL